MVNYARRIEVKITFLGTGTSHGVPVIGCNCDVCQSKDPRNQRTRSSILIETKGLSLLVDTATEFRLQALRGSISTVDAVLYTHCHADHVFGFDDLRIFSQRSGKAVPFYGNRKPSRKCCRCSAMFSAKLKSGWKTASGAKRG